MGLGVEQTVAVAVFPKRRVWLVVDIDHVQALYATGSQFVATTNGMSQIVVGIANGRDGRSWFLARPL